MPPPELVKTCEDVYFTAGFQPEELGKYREGDLDRLRALCQEEKCVAVGEIGLGLSLPRQSVRRIAKQLFIAQLALADELSLPVVIHSRDAAADTLEILKSHKSLLKRGFLMHCYSYSEEMIGGICKAWRVFSFGGTSTLKTPRRCRARRGGHRSIGC